MMEWSASSGVSRIAVDVEGLRLLAAHVYQWVNHLHNESWNVTLGIDGVTLHAH